MKKDFVPAAGQELPNKTLLSTSEVILFFSIRYRTLMRWINKEVLIPEKIGGRLYIKRSDIIKLMGEEPVEGIL
jgi:hypothetical protein